MNGFEKTEETTEAVRPFAEVSKTYSENSPEENAEMSLLENSSTKTSENKPAKVKRGKRKSTGNVKKASVERNAAIFDYAGIIFTDNEAQRPSSIRKTLPDRYFESDNDIIRKQVQKELQRIAIDVNDSEEYKNKSTKRRTRSDYFMTGDLVDNKTIRKSKGNSELNATVDSNNDASTRAIEKPSEKKTAKIKTFIKPSEVSIEKEFQDNGKAEEAIQIEIDSEPVIESSQERQLSCKPFKIPALHQFQKIKPGEHIVIKDCQSTVDLVVKGPKATSPFNVINKSCVRQQSGRNLFPECDDSESLVSVEDLEIAEADTSNLEKQNNSSIKDQTALDCDNNTSSSVIASATEERDSNDTQHMSHLHIEPDSINVTLATTNCEKNSIACAPKDPVQVNPNDTTVSINSQFIAELDAAARNNSVVEMPDDDIACRKLVFNTSASSDESVNRNSEFHSPPSNGHRNSIVTSPICSDTPTRNSEFIRNTSKISPIKDVPNYDSDTTFIRTESMNNSVIASTSRSDKNKDTSPLLFSNDNVGEINKCVSDSKQDYNATPILRKYKSQYLSTRGAQMMNMVSANTPLGTNGTRKQRISRIAKMMGQFERNGNQEIGTEEVVEDIFSVCKELPLPTDSPSFGILRKRKQPDHPEDGITPASKRKRLNFSDPEVSCRKYIENNARYSYSSNSKLVDFVPQESRVTRSSKNYWDLAQDESESIVNDTQPVQIESEQVHSESGESESESFDTESDSVDIESDSVDIESEYIEIELKSVEDESDSVEIDLDSVEDESKSVEKESTSTYPVDMSAARMENMISDGFGETLFIKNILAENINLQLTDTDVKYDNTRPICSELETCLDRIDVIIVKLTTPDYIGVYAGNMQAANIHTVADLARLTEYEVDQLPLNVEKVKKILTEYNKSIRMKPVTLASVLEIDEDTRTESVIIPLAYNDNTTLAVPIVEDTKKIAANSEPLFSDEQQTEMDMSLEEEEYNLPSTSTVKLNVSSNRDSYSRYPKNAPTSPTFAKENILDVKISGVAVKDFAPSLMLALHDRRYDPKPLVQILFGSGSNLTNTAVSMGLFKVHHLVNIENWDSVISDVITHIGILKLIYILWNMPSISHTVILASVLKNITGQNDYADLCDQLNRTGLFRYVTSAHSLSDILKQYDTVTIYKSLNEIRTAQKHNNVRELNSVINPNPSDASVTLNNLSVVELGKYVIERFGESPDMDLFLNRLFNTVSMDRYLQPVPRNMLAASPSPVNTPKKLDDSTRCFIREFKEGTVSDSVLKQLYEAVCSKMNSTEILNAFCEEMNKKL